MGDYIVLDRDGVINVDLMTYVTKPEEFKPIPGSLDAIANLNKNGFKVFIATNQACIEKEIISEAQLSDIHDYMKALLEEKGGKIDYIAFALMHLKQIAYAENLKQVYWKRLKTNLISNYRVSILLVIKSQISLLA